MLRGRNIYTAMQYGFSFVLQPFLGVSSLNTAFSRAIIRAAFFWMRRGRHIPILPAMRNLTILMALGTVLVACADSPDDGISCAELARVRAAGQVDRETALQEQHEIGLPDKSELQRTFILMDAETYRAAVYEECLRGRGLAPEDE